MKINNLLREYTSIFSTLLKITGLLLLCVILGAAVVYPLYLLATEFPRLYSWIVIAAAAVSIVIWIILTVKKAGLRPTLRWLASFALIAGAAVISIFLILNNQRFLAIPVLIAALILWGLLKMFTKKQ